MVLNDFTTQFKHFVIDLSTAKKRFPLVNKVFNKRWNPDDAKQTYLSTFSTKCWEALPESEKKHHTLRDCKACQSFYGNLPSLFPCAKRAKVAAENQITLRTRIQHLNKLESRSSTKLVHLSGNNNTASFN